MRFLCADKFFTKVAITYPCLLARLKSQTTFSALLRYLLSHKSDHTLPHPSRKYLQPPVSVSQQTYILALSFMYYCESLTFGDNGARCGDGTRNSSRKRRRKTWAGGATAAMNEINSITVSSSGQGTQTDTWVSNVMSCKYLTNTTFPIKLYSKSCI